MPGRLHRGRLPLVVLAVILAVVLAGCRVTTTVGVRVAANGSGSVTVQVVLDQQAAAEVGNVAGQLRTSDLVAAGWVVSPTTSGPDHSTVITVSHAFSHVAQLPAVLGQVAASGAGQGSTLPFTLHVEQKGGSPQAATTAVGEVDLRCGLSCFGDAGLRQAYGSEVGVNASSLEGKGGEAAARKDFVFRFTLQVPGRVTSTDATSRPGGQLVWAPTLGSSIPIRASAVVAAPKKDPPAGGGAHSSNAVVIVIFVVLVLLVAFSWRRLRRRLRGPVKAA